MTDKPKDGPAVDHRRLAAALYNTTWTFLERTDRTPEDDDEMIATAHASAYHWRQAPECAPTNIGRGHWLCSRVYSELAHGASAQYHAARYLDIARTQEVDDWDLAAALEASARAAAVSEQWFEAESLAGQARTACLDVADAEDRDVVLADLRTIPQRR